MEKSLYLQWLEKYFKGIILKTLEKLNGKPGDLALTYMFKNMLRKEYSLNGKWETLTALNTRVSADVVSMDSQLPLKKRDTLSKASGDIAKSGMKLWLNETQITAINDLIRNTQMPENIFIKKIFEDVPRVITGVYELMEYLFLKGLSSGVALVDDDNVGTGIRLDYGYLTANKFGVSVLWSTPATSKPLDDILVVLKKAKQTDGNVITDVYMDDVTFDNFAKSQQVKEQFAFSIGFFGDKTIVPVPNLEKINTMLKADNNYRFTIHIVDRTVRVEKNGVQKTLTPWEEGKVILTTSPEVGVLAYARLGEQDSPVTGVQYQTADDYILVSKYSKNDPLAEFTSSQARVVPVICNVEQIYQLDAKTVSA